MVAYIERAAKEAKAVVIGSNDAKKFLEPVRNMFAGGIDVAVAGFTEFAGELADADGWEFVDLEEIPGLLSVPLPRARLDQVPAEGGWFEPRVSPEIAVGRVEGVEETTPDS